MVDTLDPSSQFEANCFMEKTSMRKSGRWEQFAAHQVSVNLFWSPQDDKSHQIRVISLEYRAYSQDHRHQRQHQQDLWTRFSEKDTISLHQSVFVHVNGLSAASDDEDDEDFVNGQLHSHSRQPGHSHLTARVIRRWRLSQFTGGLTQVVQLPIDMNFDPTAYVTLWLLDVDTKGHICPFLIRNFIRQSRLTAEGDRRWGCWVRKSHFSHFPASGQLLQVRWAWLTKLVVDMRANSIHLHIWYSQSTSVQLHSTSHLPLLPAHLKRAQQTNS